MNGAARDDEGEEDVAPRTSGAGMNGLRTLPSSLTLAAVVVAAGDVAQVRGSKRYVGSWPMFW